MLVNFVEILKKIRTASWRFPGPLILKMDFSDFLDLKRERIVEEKFLLLGKTFERFYD